MMLRYTNPDGLIISDKSMKQYCKVVLEAPGLERLDPVHVKKTIIEHVRLALVVEQLNDAVHLKDGYFLFTIVGNTLVAVNFIPRQTTGHKRGE